MHIFTLSSTANELAAYLCICACFKFSHLFISLACIVYVFRKMFCTCYTVMYKVNFCVVLHRNFSLCCKIYFIPMLAGKVRTYIVRMYSKAICVIYVHIEYDCIYFPSLYRLLLKVIFRKHTRRLYLGGIVSPRIHYLRLNGIVNKYFLFLERTVSRTVWSVAHSQYSTFISG